VAYDLHPLFGQAKIYGFGRVGELPAPETLDKLAVRLAGEVGSVMTQYFGKSARTLRRLAVWAGGGVDASSVLGCGAEALAAGEVGYHDIETLADAGIAVITLGHGCSEEPVLRPLAKRLQKALGGGTKVGVAECGKFAMRNVHF
jgi:putative NIF3 family GTP cyclohydrolase 1 type 2